MLDLSFAAYLQCAHTPASGLGTLRASVRASARVFADCLAAHVQWRTVSGGGGACWHLLDLWSTFGVLRGLAMSILYYCTGKRWGASGWANIAVTVTIILIDCCSLTIGPVW